LDDECLAGLLQDIINEDPPVPPDLNIKVARTYQENVFHQLDPLAVRAACDAMPRLIKDAPKGLDPAPKVTQGVMDIKDVRGDPRESKTFATAVMTSVLPKDVLEAIKAVEVQAQVPVPGPPKAFKPLEVIRHYKFDHKQAEVFAMMATVFLCCVCLLFVIPKSLEKELTALMKPYLSKDGQLVHLPLGSGGTGKWHIIKAIHTGPVLGRHPIARIVRHVSNRRVPHRRADAAQRLVDRDESRASLKTQRGAKDALGLGGSRELR
jgi:hypothetical protein